MDTLLQDYRNGAMSNHGYNRFKEITYNYDLISGKVNEVDYQPGAVDQFYHRYEYDAENRITDVYTSDHKVYVGHKNLEEHEAFYEYYKHGPLARSVIGQQEVQGVDYAYTLEGWLKGVNSTALNPVYDMGGDGAGLVARDAYSFGLNYFISDYSPINSTVSPFPGFSGLFPAGYSYNPLYNGNITAMSVNIGKLNNPLLYNYQYDQLNRLVAMDAFTGLDTSNNTWNALSTDNSYKERVSYDANGNIQTYLRNGTTAGGTPLAMDNLTYNYNKDVNGNLTNNKLTSVNDAVAAGNYPDDIDDQGANNYGYDAIGNMTSDVAGGISNITWTVYGKIATITKTDGSIVAYTYDAAGNRISKTVTPATGAATTTWYVRDASGNTMAVYTANGSDSLHQTEQDLYGSSRLGLFNRNINADALLPTGTSANLIGNYVVSYFARGNKLFEGGNHLGNVLITFTDKKFGIDTNGDGIIDYYYADVVSANDYYPFGMTMPARTFSGGPGSYRYGFNGKENDNDIGTADQDYGARIYDGRLGRFLSVDPLTSKFAMLSSYQFASNRPVDGVDVDGLEFFKRDNTSYRIEYKPVIHASDVSTAVGNAVHNGLSFVWNGTFGAVLEGEKSINNYFAGGYKDPTPDIIPAFDNWQNSIYKYSTQTPIKQQFIDLGNSVKNFGNAATDLRNYEMLPSLLIAHQFTISSAVEMSATKLPLQEEIFTNSISTRSTAETYAEMTKYKGYFNTNDFIKANNPAFDLISTIEKNIVDVATTSKANLKISSWEINKLDRLIEYQPNGYNSTLQIYVKKGQYTSGQLANYRKSLNDYIAKERLQNVNVNVEEIPKIK